MLEKILDEINKGSVLSIDALAVKLQTTPAMVKSMLEHLQQMGLISTLEVCNDACSGCKPSTLCVGVKQTKQPLLYTLNKAH